MYIVERDIDEVRIWKLVVSGEVSGRPNRELVIAVPKSALVWANGKYRPVRKVSNEQVLASVLPLIPRTEGGLM